MEAASRHFARATLGLSPWGSGRWPYHGSVSCLKGQASDAGQVILRDNASGGCPTPARPAAYRSALPTVSCKATGCHFQDKHWTEDMERTGPSRLGPGGCQALSLLLTFFSLHCCFVLKQVVTGCMLERTVDPGTLDTPGTSFHMM